MIHYLKLLFKLKWNHIGAFHAVENKCNSTPTTHAMQHQSIPLHTLNCIKCTLQHISSSLPAEQNFSPKHHYLYHSRPPRPRPNKDYVMRLQVGNLLHGYHHHHLTFILPSFLPAVIALHSTTIRRSRRAYYVERVFDGVESQVPTRLEMQKNFGPIS